MDIPKQNLDLFEFSGTAVHRRGWRRPISIRVEPPSSDRPGEYVCSVACSLIDGKIRPIRANEPRQAYSLAFRFLRQVLSDFSFFRQGGDRFRLPRVPPWEEDWVPYDPPPEHGLKMRAKAVDSDGEMGHFYVGVSAPKHEGDGYSAEVWYGNEEQPAATVRASTLAEAYYAGLDWIADRLDKDRITLLDLWNEPNEIPKRPKA